MNVRIAKSLQTLRDQLNERYPLRSKLSDGWIGDAAHAARKSDHNPNRFGVVTAFDVTADLGPNERVSELVYDLQISGDRRIKYIIWAGRITVAGNIRQWKRYHGANPHIHHFHLSVASDPELYDDPTPWTAIQNSIPAKPTPLSST